MSSLARKVRVAVADDQNVARSFFEFHIAASVQYELVASLSAAEDILPLCERERIDLVLLDIMMRRGLDGLTVAQRLKQNHPEIKIILVTSMAEERWEQKARDAGVESFWYKEYSDEPLLSVMDRTMAGERVYPLHGADVPFGQVTRSQLTQRELDVLRELTAGSTNEEIAEHLFISVNTVRRHIQNLLTKTGFENRLELAIHATALGLVVSDRNRTRNPDA